jgi:hypothetical protein
VIHLFHLFWPLDIFQNIVNETNRYSVIENDDGETKGNQGWIPFTVLEFKALLVI